MVLYNFKRIAPVPSRNDFIDIVLTRTQRRTPTVVHPQFQISRIRSFYMRKVKFTQATFHEKLSAIVDEFPKLDDIHPFYADLINVLYDRDHYKVALSQISIARQLIDNVSKDYLRMLKYGDSPFRCKQLKRAALGRMVTVMKKQGPTLEYLEEVRKHLARLPSIDPTTRTLLVCGYPNVGKSSFMNKVTRADVEVQPYAFTTKSLFVGHMDYKFQRWQVIDTPGVLDHPLEERNNIEMQSITALAHLHCAVLYFLDISQQCGYSIEQQVSLFANISPLFVNKPVMLVASKVDAQPWETLDPKHKKLIMDLVERSGAIFKTMSNFTEAGIVDVKTSACEALLAKRIAVKIKNTKKVTEVMNRVTVTMPKPRDGKKREVAIPASVLAARTVKPVKPTRSERQAAAAASSSTVVIEGEDEDDMDDDDEGGDVSTGGAAPIVRRWLERDREAAGGGPGVYRTDTTRYWDLADPEWKTDIVPELLDGKNIADFFDKDIVARMEALEAEEDALLEAEEAEAATRPAVDEAAEAFKRELADTIRRKKEALRLHHQREKSKNRMTLPRRDGHMTADEATEKLRAVGMPEEAIDSMISSARVAGTKRGRSLTKRGAAATTAAASAADGEERMDEDGPRTSSAGAATRKRARSSSRTIALVNKYGADAVDADGRPRHRSSSRDPATHMSSPAKEGLKSEAQKKKAHKMAKRVLKVKFDGKQGESDRFIGTKMPKHLYSGKRGIGSADWR